MVTMPTDGFKMIQGDGKMTFHEAAKAVLQEREPMHYRELADAIVSARMVEIVVATPAFTVNARINNGLPERGCHGRIRGWRH